MWVRFLLPLLYNFKYKKKFFKKKNTGNFKKIKTSKNLIFKNYTYAHKFNKIIRTNKKPSFGSFFFKKVPNLVTYRHYLNSHELRKTCTIPLIMELTCATFPYLRRFLFSPYFKIYNIYFTLNNINYFHVLTNVTSLITSALADTNSLQSVGSDVNSFRYFYLNNFLLISRTNRFLSDAGKKHHLLGLFNRKFKNQKATFTGTSAERFKNENLLFSNFGNLRKREISFVRSLKTKFSSFKYFRTALWVKFKVVKNSLFSFSRKTNLTRNLLDVNLPSRTVSNYRPYFFISKIFFRGLSFTVDILIRSNINFFLLSNEDIYYSDVIKVTKQYKN